MQFLLSVLNDCILCCFSIFFLMQMSNKTWIALEWLLLSFFIIAFYHCGKGELNEKKGYIYTFCTLLQRKFPEEPIHVSEKHSSFLLFIINSFSCFSSSSLCASVAWHFFEVVHKSNPVRLFFSISVLHWAALLCQLLCLVILDNYVGDELL